MRLSIIVLLFSALVALTLAAPANLEKKDALLVEQEDAEATTVISVESKEEAVLSDSTDLPEEDATTLSPTRDGRGLAKNEEESEEADDDDEDNEDEEDEDEDEEDEKEEKEDGAVAKPGANKNSNSNNKKPPSKHSAGNKNDNHKKHGNSKPVPILTEGRGEDDEADDIGAVVENQDNRIRRGNKKNESPSSDEKASDEKDSDEDAQNDEDEDEQEDASDESNEERRGDHRGDPNGPQGQGHGHGPGPGHGPGQGSPEQGPGQGQKSVSEFLSFGNIGIGSIGRGDADTNSDPQQFQNEVDQQQQPLAMALVERDDEPNALRNEDSEPPNVQEDEAESAESKPVSSKKKNNKPIKKDKDDDEDEDDEEDEDEDEDEEDEDEAARSEKVKKISRSSNTAEDILYYYPYPASPVMPQHLVEEIY